MKKPSGDLINPVLIKELRQYLHNRLLLTVMGLMLVAQLLMLLLFTGGVIQPGLSGFLGYGGMMLFAMVAVAMGGASFLVVSVGGLIRFLTERADTELDFSRISVLTPGAIVRGKLAGAVLMLLFIFSICLPFMVIAYFLRGVSMMQMLVISAVLFAALLVLTQLALLAGATGKRWVSLPFALAVLQIGVPMAMLIFAATMTFASGGIFDPELRYVLCSGLIAMGLLVGAGFFMSAALISPVNANRMFATRIFLTAALPGGSVLLFLPTCLLASSHIGEILPAFIGMLALAVIGLIVTLAAFERDAPGERVLRGCPGNFPGRVCHFLFSSGWAGGVALAVLLAAAAGLALLLYENITASRYEHMIKFLLALMTAIFYLIFYAETALLLRSWFRRLAGWAWWLIVAGGCSLMPFLLGIAPLKTVSILYPFVLLAEASEERHVLLIISMFLTLVCLAVLSPKIFAAFRTHRAPAAEAENAR